MVIGTAESFLLIKGPIAVRRQPPASQTQSWMTMRPNELFNSTGWGAIERELDQVPIFSVANAEGQPLKYRIEKGGSSFEVPVFYTHVEDALQELEKAKENTPTLKGLDINPYPLGGIFRMWAEDAAVIVPNKMAIIQAGAPPTAIPMGQQVPLFACMEITQHDKDGKPVLPLFFELADAQSAVSQAVSLDGGKAEDLEVVGLNLGEAVNLLTNARDDATAFQFVPPASSLKHIREYLSG